MKAKHSKRLFPVIAAVLAITLMVSCTVWGEEQFAEEPVEGSTLIDLKDYLWDIPEGADANEMMTLLNRNNTIIEDLESLFTEDSMKEYKKAFSKFRQNKNTSTADDANLVAENLIQTASVAENVIFIWEEQNMPCVDGEEFTEEELDNGSRLYAYGYEPRIIKYLTGDPQNAKGNVIVLCRNHSADAVEGHPAAKAYQKMGYNVFMLATRSGPYSTDDASMDLQRAIRIVRQTVSQENYGGQDMIAVASWGGAGKTEQNLIYNMYGYSTPADGYCSDYVPDEIDAINSDMDVAIMIYSAFSSVQQTGEDNPNLPAFYICTGSEDATGRYEDSLALYEEMKNKTEAVLTVMEGAGHGFGIGQEGAAYVTEECKNQLPEADEFMQAHLGYSANGKAAEAASDAESEDVVGGTVTISEETGTITLSYFDGTEIEQSQDEDDILVQVPRGQMLEDVNLYVKNGDILINGVLSKTYKLENTHGDITVYLPEDTGFHAQLTTISDLFECDFMYDVTMKHHEYIFGDEEVDLTIETIGGSISILKQVEDQ